MRVEADKLGSSFKPNAKLAVQLALHKEVSHTDASASKNNIRKTCRCKPINRSDGAFRKLLMEEVRYLDSTHMNIFQLIF